MTTSSSSVPVLGPVLYFTQTDGYSYDVDNRPLFHLDTNIRHINTSLVGIGYGEHASLGGGALSPGRAVALAPNGSVFYPVTNPSTANPTENIVGLVIGTTDTGLNRVIWSSKHLDLDVVGLSSTISGASGMYLVTSNGDLGVLSLVTTPTLATQYVLGRIKSGPYIEVNTSTDLISSNIASTVGHALADNHANLYGVTRLRNLLLFLDGGAVPVQYAKRTVRIKNYKSDFAVTNPLNAALASNRSSITTFGSVSPSYSTAIDNLVLKEVYSQFTQVATTDDFVSVGGFDSTWPSRAYATALPYNNNAENLELQSILTGANYNSNVALFKAFNIEKYYQYCKVDYGTPTSGKIQAIATVFRPLVTDQGGESSNIIVWDFFSYDIDGLETYKYRVVLLGESADAALADNTIFPASLITY